MSERATQVNDGADLGMPVLACAMRSMSFQEAIVAERLARHIGAEPQSSRAPLADDDGATIWMN
jgi:hypothetical protein